MGGGGGFFFYINPPSGYKMSHSYLITNIKERENDVVEDRNEDGGDVSMPKKTKAGQIKSCKNISREANWQKSQKSKSACA